MTTSTTHARCVPSRSHGRQEHSAPALLVAPHRVRRATPQPSPTAPATAAASGSGGHRRPRWISTFGGLAVVLFALSAARPALSDDATGVTRIGEDFAISGRIPNMQQRIECRGHTFLVALQNLRYEGRADRTLLDRQEDGRLTIWIALKDVSVTIERITVSGRPGSAVCGPTAIRIADRRELWLAFDFEQSADNRATLTLTKTRFGLPHDNWSIGSPAWVSTRGFAMSKERVIGGVRDGLAGSRGRIEQEMLQIAPSVLAKFVASEAKGPAGRDGLEEAVRKKLAADGLLPRLAANDS